MEKGRGLPQRVRTGPNDVFSRQKEEIVYQETAEAGVSFTHSVIRLTAL